MANKKHKNRPGQENAIPGEHQINGTRLTANITGTFNFDWNANTYYVLTPEGAQAVVLGNDNLPTETNSKEIKGIIKVGSAVTLPANWVATADSDAFDNTLDNHFRAWVSDENVVTFTNKNKAASGGGTGTENIAAGAFSGALNVSGGNRYYDDYTSGAVVNLSLSTTKALGATATVRVKGGLLGTIPSNWNISGQGITTDPTKSNELTLLYVKEDDIRIINRIVPYFEDIVIEDEYIVWETTNATDEGSGTLGLRTGNSGWNSGGYGTNSINGNNAVLWELGGPKVILGFSSTFTAISPSTLNRPILVLLTSTSMQIFEDGVQIYNQPEYITGQTAALRLNNGVVSVEVDGVTKYTSEKSFALPLTPIGLISAADATAKVLNARYETASNITTRPW